jgi:outer membrane protein OmpA-like peptidoglycan-associated protein
MRAFLALILLVSGLASTAPAEAQRMGGQRFTPAGSEDGIFETEGADRRAILWPYVALHAHYALNPVVVVDGNSNRLGSAVEHLLNADLVASMAVWEGLELGFVLPVTLYSAGDDAQATAAGLPVAPGTVLGDVSVRVAYRIRIAEHTALALHVPVLFPTNPDDDVLALGWGVRPTIAFMQRLGPVELLLNAFFLARESQAAVDYRGGHELGARLGVRVDLSGQWQTALLGEIGFSTAIDDFFGSPTTPAEVRVGLEHWFDRNWRISGFGGTGIGPGVGAPDLRVGVALAFGDNVPYRPRPSATEGDRDGDGIPDEQDECPDEVEDPDGFEDEDGCPEPDNDGDGVLDAEDICPNEPETMNGIADEDGCPDLIRVEGTLITTFDRVHFRTGSEEILEDSHPMLIEVANVLRANPGMRIRVEGHTDDAGDDQTNLELSRRRADSVRRFLAEHGASGHQVEAVGHGETRPIASNATRAGRARNRRVEFHIEERD